MITLLHGEDTRKSRDELNRLKLAATGKEIRHLEGKSLEERDLIQALSSSSLFEEDRVVIIENLFSGLGKKIKKSQQLATIVKDEGSGIQIILWEDKEIGKTAINALGSITQRLFPLPTIIFQFLDNLSPGKTNQVISLYEQLVNQEAPDLVHAMMVKRIKHLLLLKSGGQLEGQQAWQLTRLTNQSRPFTLERLISLYQSLKRLEYHRNSGQGVFDLREATEMVLINL